MKLTENEPNKVLPLIYRGLLIILIIIGLLFIGGTVYSVFFNKRGAVLINNEYGKDNERKEQTFSGIGQIRVSTADPQPGMVILFVAFTYNPDDKAFSEELVLRVRVLREIINDYFGSFSLEELQKTSEDTLKTELLQRFNGILRLGRIETLFFIDFMVIG